MLKDKEEIDWYNKVCQDLKAPLFSFVLKITKNESQSHEIVQETFLKLWTQNFTEIKNYVAPWLYTVARNQSIDTYRKTSKTIPLEINLPLNLDEKIDIKKVFNKIQSLPLDQQEVIILKFKEGYSYKEIAEITNKSVSLVGVLIHNALKTLAEDFKEVSHE